MGIRGQRWERDRTFGGMMDIFMILIMAMVSWLYINVKNYQIVHLKYEQFTVS